MNRSIFFEIRDDLIGRGVCQDEFTPEWAQLINIAITQSNDANAFTDKTNTRFEASATTVEAKIENANYSAITPHRSIYGYIVDKYVKPIHA